MKKMKKKMKAALKKEKSLLASRISLQSIPKKKAAIKLQKKSKTNMNLRTYKRVFSNNNRYKRAIGK